jgi:predicted alpha/beta superfamily hydrolase
VPQQKTLKLNAGLIILFLCKLAVGYSQTAKPISIGVVDSFKSALLNEKRELLISVPKSFAANKTLRYPVVYLLDGDTYFQSCTATIDHLSAANGNAVIPEMIVVGLPNIDRVRDLTTSVTIQNPGSGGAEKFTSFLEKELIPYIEKHYPTAPFRMLVGHSLGGLFVMNALAPKKKQTHYESLNFNNKPLA